MSSEKATPCEIGVYPYHVFPSILTLASNIDLEKTGVSKVQKNPNLAFFGRDVLLGFVDTGIDYRHKAFQYNDGSSRIVSIWDQTIQNGISSEKFPYGTEYTREQINQALKSDDPLARVPTNDENGHGTAVASIAAGSEDLEHSFRGVVPEAELIVVKLKQAKQNLREIAFVPEDAICYQESDLIFGIEYILSVAQMLKRPVAICIALGTSQGGHDGRGATSSYLSFLSQRPKTGITIAVGNEGNAQRHYYGRIDAGTNTSDFEMIVNSKDKKFALEIWAYAPSRLTLDIITPTGESTREIFAQFNACRKFSFIYQSSVVFVNNFIIEEETGDQMILVRFENPLEGIWHFRVRNVENMVSSFHAWLPADNLISNETFFLKSNPDTTLTSPGTAVNPMTVTAYNQLDDSILIKSGRGYTRSNTIKPDFAAPGFRLTCATINGGYGEVTGSGSAAAYAAGIVAMLLEWGVVRGNYPAITGMDISRLLIRGADREEGMMYPNTIWGYGKINIDGVFMKLRI
ncbi:MAG: S8 family peptidase [Velocimicrobium sp.]